jgi:uncharacterized protein (TIGR04255 family)
MDWEPAHADHSIDSVNVLVTFTEPMDGDTFDEVIIPVRRAAATHNFSNRVETQEPAVELPIPSAPGQPMNFAINVGNVSFARRVAFQRQVEGAVISEFSIGSRSLAMWTAQYRRWAQFFGELRDFFRAVDSAWPVGQRVKSIRLQYVDRFLSVPGGASHFQVVAATPQFLLIPTDDPLAAFHVHCGWFDYSSKPGIRVLTNVNIDASDVRPPQVAGQQRSLTILTLAQYESLDSFLQSPVENAHELHLELKNLFRQTISSEAAARVGLSE